MKRYGDEVPMKMYCRLTLILLTFTMALGCEQDFVLGGDPDVGAGRTPDASTPDASALDAGPDVRTVPDANTPDANTPDANTPTGTLYANIRLLSSLRTAERSATLVVELRDEPEFVPETREVDSNEDCNVVEQRAGRIAQSIDVGATVSRRIDGGSWTDIEALPDNSFYEELATDLPADTSVDIRIDIPGRARIERTLSLAHVTQQTPTPIPTAINWRYDHPAGDDLTVTFAAEGDPGTVAFVAARDPLGLDPSPWHLSLSCEANERATTMTFPWDFVEALIEAPEVSAPSVWLIYTPTPDTRTVDDVVIDSRSAAVSQISTVTVVD